jgi:glycosyltransferase involved in cell wall biosynthesis
MNDRINIALLTAHTLENRKQSSWGGTVDYMIRTLQKYCGDVHPIGSVSSKAKLLGKVIHKSSRILFKKNYPFNHTFAVSKEYAHTVTKKLTERPFDVIVAPSCGTEIAFLETDIPIVLIEDATFALLHNYYPQYSNLLQRSVYEAHALQGLAIKRACSLFYTSHWAAQSAIEDYHADAQKVHVHPFGANFHTPPSPEIAQAKQKTECCRLLFVGVDWQRKGGEIAFETLLQLEELGILAELIVLGCTPPKTFSHERMTVIPFLNKRDERQHREFNRLFETSSFMILPTRSDCVPMVLAEANAFGLPVLTTQTGGIPSIVREGENGFMLPLSARGSDFAKVIAEVYQDEQRYIELVISSRAAFEQRLNWDAWGIAFTKSIKALLEQEAFPTGPRHPSHIASSV